MWVNFMLILSGDTSLSLCYVYVSDEASIGLLHGELCRGIYGFVKCQLHFKKMSRKYKNKCIRIVLDFADKSVFSGIIESYVIVPKRGKLKYARKCFYGLIKSILDKFDIKEIIYPSDFYKKDPNLVSRMKTMLGRYADINMMIMDNHDAVEIADIIVNVYRIKRKIFLQNMVALVC